MPSKNRKQPASASEDKARSDHLSWKMTVDGWSEAIPYSWPTIAGTPPVPCLASLQTSHSALPWAYTDLPRLLTRGLGIFGLLVTVVKCHILVNSGQFQKRCPLQALKSTWIPTALVADRDFAGSLVPSVVGQLHLPDGYGVRLPIVLVLLLGRSCSYEREDDQPHAYISNGPQLTEKSQRLSEK